MLKFILLFVFVWFAYRIYRVYRGVKRVIRDAGVQIPFPPPHQQSPFQQTSRPQQPQYSQHSQIEEAQWEEIRTNKNDL